MLVGQRAIVVGRSRIGRGSPAHGMAVHEGAYRRGTLAVLAECREITQAQQRLPGTVEGVEIESLPHGDDVAAQQRVGNRVGIPDPVHVATPQGGESSVKC